MEKLIFVFATGLFSGVLFASHTLRIGDCPGKGDRSLGVNNEQVLEWKETTENQWTGRAHIEGNVERLYADRNGHVHFSVKIGYRSTETIEVVYNEEFGTLPDNLKDGMKVSACCDYITARSKAGNYPASPDCAIIHWVHMNPRSGGHLPGYLAIENRTYGQNYRD